MRMMDVRGRMLVGAAIVAVMLGAPRLSAWGAAGHHVVARIAWGLLTPAVRAQATTLLGGGQDAFVTAATWADEVRSARPETYNWHFVDIPYGEMHYNAARDCPATEKGDCVIAEIARATADLRDAGTAAVQRAEALKYLIHFVGDLHQPLHAIDNKDRGGNDVRVLALRADDGRNTNLHAAWDTGLINLSDETEAARAARLLSATLEIHPHDMDLDPIMWAEQSHDTAVRVTYAYPSFSPAGPGPDPIALNDAYRTRAVAAIDRQLQLGGHRLAALLNSLLK
jgi:hypothetical protein